MKKVRSEKPMATGGGEELIQVLQARFEINEHRHPGISWAEVEARLNSHPALLRPLGEMEKTGGEPDVVGRDEETGELLFVDCSSESPKGRTGICYDREGRESRKEHQPKGSAMEMASAMGIEILTEEQYRELQSLGEFDARTSSWVKTPEDIRKLGGALFGDRRFGHVSIYHNGAQSYYGARAFRGMLRV